MNSPLIDPSDDHRGCIVVGVDGSAASLRARAYATGLAQLDRYLQRCALHQRVGDRRLTVPGTHTRRDYLRCARLKWRFSARASLVATRITLRTHPGWIVAL